MDSTFSLEFPSSVESAEITLQQLFVKNISSFSYQEQTSFDALMVWDELWAPLKEKAGPDSSIL